MNNDSISVLEDRVADLEKTIGDFMQVFDALKTAIGGIERPTCPPYCAHIIDNDEEDDLPLEDRVEDIKRCIGDFTKIFDNLEDALGDARRPACPPYCAHESEPEEQE